MRLDMRPKNETYERDWMLNWNLLTIILGITLILEVVVVLISFPPERKGYTINTNGLSHLNKCMNCEMDIPIVT